MRLNSALLLAFACLSVLPCVGAPQQQAGTTGSQPISTKQKILAGPKSAAGVLAGLTIGVPVKISRDIRHEIRRYAGVSRGDMGNEFGFVENMYVAATAIPYGIMSGFIMGGIRGTEHAITYGAHQPFSKESLGMVDPPEPEKKEEPQPIVQKDGIGGLGQ